MAPESGSHLAGRPEPPELRAYGTVFLLLFAAALLLVLVPRVVDGVAGWLVAVFGDRLVGAVVYASVGVAVVAAGYAAWRRRRDPARRLDAQELLQLGGVTAGLFLVAAYVLHGGTDLPPVPEGVLDPLLTVGIAMVVPAVVAARARDVALPVGLPDRDGRVVAAAGAFLAAIVGVGVVATVAVLQQGPFRFGTVVDGFGPSITAGRLLWDGLVPGLAGGVGRALLSVGVVLALFRERAGPAAAVAGVTTIVGTERVAPFLLGFVADPSELSANLVGLLGASATVAALSLAGGLVAVGLTGLVDHEREGGATTVGGASIGLLVVAVQFGIVLLAAPLLASVVLSVLPITLVGAVAAVGYDRARTLWVPALTFATYQILTSSPVAWAIGSLVP